MSETHVPPTESVDATEVPDASNRAVAYQQIVSWIEKARNALEEIGKVLVDYDTRHQATEKASTYLNGALTKAHTALGELNKTAQSLKDGASEIPVRALTTTLAHASTAVAHILDLAHKYDEQFQLSSKVALAIAPAKEQATAAVAIVATYAAATAATANAQLQGVSDGLRAKLANVAASGLEKALPAAVLADDKLHVSEKAAAAGSAVIQKAKELDERFGLSGYVGVAVGRAQTLDQKVTGGKVAPAIMGAYYKGLELAGYVQEKFEEKKREHAAASSSPLAPDTKE